MIVKIEKSRLFKILLLALIFATLVFIAVQSLLPPAKSTAESEAISDMIEVIIPSGTPSGDAVHKNVSSIGHFAEFALLGAEIAVYIFFFERRRLCLILAPVFSPLVALLDETLQYISKRTPDIADVWTDTAGFVSAYLMLMGIFYLQKYIRKRIKDKNGENNIG